MSGIYLQKLLRYLCTGLFLAVLVGCGDANPINRAGTEASALPAFDVPNGSALVTTIPTSSTVATNTLQQTLNGNGQFFLTFSDSIALPDSTTAVNSVRATQIQRVLTPPLEDLNQLMSLPGSDVAIVVRQCGLANAFYISSATEIVLCTELLDTSYNALLNLFDQDAQLANQAAGDVFSFIMFHEIAHALDDLLDLPIFGNTESAADAIATVLSAETGRPQNALFAAYLFSLSIDVTFVDVHHAGDDRAGDLVCWVLGSDSNLLETEGLNQLGQQFIDAGRDCAGEYAQQLSAVEIWIPGLRDSESGASLAAALDLDLRGLARDNSENALSELAAGKVIEHLNQLL